MARRLSTSRRARSALATLACIATLVGGCASDPVDAETQPAAVFTKPEQAIYAAILARTFGTPSYVLADHTIGFDASPEQAAEEFHVIAQELGGLLGDAFVYFWSANQASQGVPTDLALGAPYSLIDQATLSSLLASDTGGWSGFFARFPEAPGVLTVAHVGFDASGTQALAFLRWQAGGLAMWCRYFLLEQNGDTWSIVDDVITVIA